MPNSGASSAGRDTRNPGRYQWDIKAAGTGLIALIWVITFAAVSSFGQTVLTNNNSTAFADAVNTGGVVTLDFDGTITLTTSLNITNSVTVDGSGHAVTIRGASSSVMFIVTSNASLVLRTVTLADGIATNWCPGAITNTGTLEAYNCVFTNNRSQPLTAVWFWAVPWPIAVNSLGGAIFNSGSMLVSNSTFIQNSAIGGAGGDVLSVGFAGAAGLGGAIYNTGIALVTDCTFSGNRAIGGSGVDGNIAEDPSIGGEAQGGAIFNSGSIIVSNSTFVLNLSSSGAGGGGTWANYQNENPAGPGATGGNAFGGGLYSASGAAIVVNSTFLSNSTASGAGGAGGGGVMFGYLDGGNGGNGGNAGAGAIWVTSGYLFLTNATLANNASTGGQGGQGGPPYVLPGAGGFAGAAGTNGAPGLAQGAALGNSGGTVVVKNSIFGASPGSTNFFGSMRDAGNNLATDDSTSLTSATSLNGVDPMLGALGYYGGNTETIPLLLGSPAINAADPLAFPSVDQRGRHRPSGPAPDIGAFEYTFPTFGALSVTEAGAQLSLLGEAGNTCFIDVSSNLVDWTTLSTNSLDATNAVEILDPTPSTSGARYYRARLQ
jgi:hypothetical protein